MLQLIDYCFEAMFRHPKCPEDWDVYGFQLLLVKLTPARLRELTHEAIRIKIALAKERAARATKTISFAAQIIYGRLVPFYVTTTPFAFADELIQNATTPLLISSKGEETQANPNIE
ncbi:hypothetical protein EGJ86_06095 [Pseudomonas sp. o96-267]|uniref:hypothetical protein n=1 Tax=Pseudomonas sp. o96-267 TaxID=2479853 RepID=UPI000F774FBC|nr:hypothetical protein [Pseudomonas sp. o96-267]RRV41876.1 hypothetical protein EGJ86_06095 [Pseudomonas sp. o96-267]